MNAPQPIALESGPLRVVWHRRGDRFAHEIGVVHQGKFLSLLESLEGSPDDRWPMSPVLQEVHVEQRERAVVLAVGQAGHSHWSLSVEADAASGEIRFDVACRVRSEPDWLGSSYSYRSTNVELPESQVARFQTAAGTCELHAGGAIVRGAGAGGHEMPVLRIEAHKAASALPVTIQWRYRLLLP